MAKIRVYELAKELGRDNKQLMEVIRELGIEVKTPTSTLAPDEEGRVRARLAGGAAASRSSAPARSGAPSGAPPSGRPAAPVIRRKGSPPPPAAAAEPRREPAPGRTEQAPASVSRAAAPASPVGSSAAAAPVVRRPAPVSVERGDAGEGRPRVAPSAPASPSATPAGAGVEAPAAPAATSASVATAATSASVATTGTVPSAVTPTGDQVAAAPAPSQPGAAARVAAPNAAAPAVATPAGAASPSEAAPPVAPATPAAATDRTAVAPAPLPAAARAVETAPTSAPAPSAPSPDEVPPPRPSAPAGAAAPSAARPAAAPQGNPVAAATSAPAAAQTRTSAPPIRREGGARDAETREGVSPPVGARIELPQGTRRLPGGMASRMREEPPAPPPTPAPIRREARDTGGPFRRETVGSGGPARREGPGSGGPLRRDSPGAPARRDAAGNPVRRDDAPVRREATTTAARPGTTEGEARREGPSSTPIRRDAATAESLRREREATAAPPTPPAGELPGPDVPTLAEGELPPGAVVEERGGRQVVRNADGVIVGVASRRSEPKIVDFIKLAAPRKRQQVIITDAKESARGGRATQRKAREERAQQASRRRKMLPRGPRGRGPGARHVSTVEMSDAKKRVRVDEAIQIAELARQMSVKAPLVLKKLWGLGLRGLTINSSIDVDTAELVAGEFGYSVENVSFSESDIIGDYEDEGEPRAPVVTVMGHVDHGKTSLLDRIRSANVAGGEAGGITQHIGAYRVETAKGPVVFLDTPGHEAFSAMRARGAQATDVVVLVVAADDGVMPTTIEAIKHAQDAGVPLVVALNKIDKPEANPGRVKQGLMEYGLVGEEFGGETIITEVSAKTGYGIEDLLENLAVQAEILELRAPEEGRARGVVIEARIDKGRGSVATLLVQSGTLNKGDIVVANEYSGRVRTILDDRGRAMDYAGPSTPVEIQGLDGIPAAGDDFVVVEKERDAKELVSYRRDMRRRKESVRQGPSIQDFLARQRTPTLKIVLKADVHGSAEALKKTLQELSTAKVKVEVIKSEVGSINETDIKVAKAAEAVVFGFNVKPAGKAGQLADHEGVAIHSFSIIYEAEERTRELMLGLLEPEYREKEQGEAEVRALFPIPRLGTVAGCRVLRGLITRHSKVRVVRNGEVLLERGDIGSLRVFKDDVREVREGFECGIVVAHFNDVQPGDIIQAFEIEAIPPTL